MRIFDETFLVADTETGFDIGNINAHALEQLGGRAEVRLRLHKQTGLVLPEIINKPALSTQQVTMNGWINMVIMNKDKTLAPGFLDTMTASLISQHPSAGLTREIVQVIVDAPLEAKINETNSVDGSILEYAEGDLRALQILKSRLLIDDVEYKHPNQTMKMLKETDTVSLALPEADIVVTHPLGTSYVTPNLNEDWARVYPNLLYNYKEIRGIIMEKNPNKRMILIDDLLSLLTSPQMFDLKLSQSMLNDLRERFEEIPLEHVYGDEENDVIPILPNEQGFYDNMIQFMKWHIRKFHQSILGNDEVAIEIKTEQDFNAGRLPVRLLEYFSSIIKTVTKQSLMHSGNFLYVSGDPNNDYDEDDDDLTSEKGKDTSERDSVDKTNYIDRRSEENRKKSDLDAEICQYLEASAMTQTAAVWAEAIIKLMRWGNRRIRNLIVGENNPSYFNLFEMKTHNRNVANLLDFEVEQDESGRTLDLLGASFVDFKDASGNPTAYPFLLLGREVGYLPNNEKSIPVTYTTTLFDIVHQFKTGVPIAYDIEYVNGKFKVDREDSYLAEYPLAQVAQSKRMAKVIDELKDFAVDNGIPSIDGTAYCIMNQSALSIQMSLEPLVPRLAKDSSSRNSAVHGTLLAIFNEGSTDFDSLELGELLNWYNDNVYPTHLALFNKAFGFEAEEEAKQLNSKNYAASALFTNNDNSPVDEETVEEGADFVYPIYEGEELEFGKIEGAKGSGKIVGAYAIMPSGGKVYATAEEVKSFSLNVPTIHLGVAMRGMFEVMLSADNGLAMESVHKVVSPASVGEIYANFLRG